jgi:hypothetical protein
VGAAIYPPKESVGKFTTSWRGWSLLASSGTGVNSPQQNQHVAVEQTNHTHGS